MVRKLEHPKVNNVLSTDKKKQNSITRKIIHFCRPYISKSAEQLIVEKQRTQFLTLSELVRWDLLQLLLRQTILPQPLSVLNAPYDLNTNKHGISIWKLL